MTYTTITTEGGLLPADILDAIAAAEIEGQRPQDFGLARGRNLTDEISAAWQAARNLWASFQYFVDRLREDDPGTTVTRERWVLPLLDVLGYRLSFNQQAYTIEGRTYAISHRAGDDDAPPVHIVGVRADLDARPPSGRPRLSPHALVQEYLNSTEQLWGIATNGERLRLLRDSSRFTRPSYVEFDLRAMFEGEQFSEFALLFRLLHRSRLPHTAADAPGCWLERYHQQAVESGGRVRENLRVGVEQALKELGNGLLRHPHNTALRQRLATGLVTGRDGEQSLTPLGFYRQLLRLVYRMLFLMVAEERNLIAAEHADAADMFAPDAYRPPADWRLRIYREHYSLGRLRRLAESPGAGRGPYGDLWLGLRTSFRLFEGSDEQMPRRLGLAPLDGDLFSAHACAALTEDTRLANADLLRAIRALSLYQDRESKSLRRVNYGALDVEELGSVYESLLDYRPVIRGDEELKMQNAKLKMDHAQGLSEGQAGSGTTGSTAPSTPDRANPAPQAPSSDHFAFLIFHFELTPGTERKTTGSYYTRPELVQELIKSALDPLIAERLKAAERALPRGDAARLQQAQEEALLSLKVCDPACGSGHFLLAAARRIGRELARVRSGEEQPTPSQFRRAVRDVIQHCIFGVDLNPLAVDLCKLALWIEGHNAGLPLSFFDHHIRRGNSLVGARGNLVEQGIPDEAYKPVSGDDKKLATSLKKRNRQERELYLRQGGVQRRMFEGDGTELGDLAASARSIDALPDESVAAVREKARRLREIERATEPQRQRFTLWTAAFFQPITGENARYVPTSADLFEFDPLGEKALMAAPLADEIGFFHWELEFPHVFAGERGGFDVVLGNPPWERIKLQEQEHFVDVPAIRNAPNKAARERLIQAWRQGSEQQRARIARFDTARQRAEAESRFVRGSGRFPLTAVGDVNTYALFAEHSRDLLRGTGRAGIIVPTGIATDDTTKAFFGDLNQRRQLVSLYDFENREKIFADVDSRYKFCLLTLGRTQQPTRFLFFATSVSDLADPRRAFSLTPDEVLLINPNTRTAPVFRTQADAELTKQIYRRVPVLVKEQGVGSGEWGVAHQSHSPPGNPWGVRFMTMFHMSGDSHLFHDQPGPGRLPLYEAKLLHQFTHRWATYANGAARELTPTELADPHCRVTPRYWVPQEEVAARLAGRWQRQWLLGFRDITNATNERTAIFSLLPRVGVGHTAPIMLFAQADVLQIACFLATINGLALDFVVRQKIGGTHLTYTYLHQLPVLPPEAFSAEDIAYIVPRVLELVYTAWDMQPFAEDLWSELGSSEWGVGVQATIWQRWQACNAERADQLIPRSAGLAGGDAPGGTMLPPDTDFPEGRTIRHDQPDPARGDVDSGEHRRGLRPRESGRIHSVSENSAGLTERAGDTPAAFGAVPDRQQPADRTDPGRVRGSGQAASHPDPSATSEVTTPSSLLPPPFTWNEERRARIRAELDVRIARLYGLTRDELRYILDPHDVHGPDFPGETFRVLKEKEQRLYGEYRTRCLVLEELKMQN